MAAEQDKINVGSLVTITVVGIHVTLVTAFGVAALLGMADRDAEAVRWGEHGSPYAADIAEQQRLVSEGDTGGMSIHRAMDRVVITAQRAAGEGDGSSDSDNSESDESGN